MLSPSRIASARTRSPWRARVLDDVLADVERRQQRATRGDEKRRQRIGEADDGGGGGENPHGPDSRHRSFKLPPDRTQALPRGERRKPRGERWSSGIPPRMERTVVGARREIATRIRVVHWQGDVHSRKSWCDLGDATRRDDDDQSRPHHECGVDHRADRLVRSDARALGEVGERTRTESSASELFRGAD